MDSVLDLEAFPIHLPQSERYTTLVTRCRSDLDQSGICNLEGFLRPAVAVQSAETLTPMMEKEAFRHTRLHNIYFKDKVDELPPDHPALTQFETKNFTLCADQIGSTPIEVVYAWRPLRHFLAQIMCKDQLHTMDDTLARVNVMSYKEGDALGWHFDRSEFTTTLLLQAPDAGGVFQYRTGLRTNENPNYDGVARLLRGEDTSVEEMVLTPGTLNVFRGVDTPHRVTSVEGKTPRMIAVFSYFDRPGVAFSPKEQVAFYGRTSEAELSTR